LADPAVAAPAAPGIAAISPHAGWYYAGAIARSAFSSLDRDADTVVILGGHLAASSPVLAFMEDVVRSPLGLMEIDRELREALLETLGGRVREDRYRDNTVEVLVPMAQYFFPRARLLALRLPANAASYETGRSLARAAQALGRKLVVVGSTDLTHYGSNYGFSPQGFGPKALAFVRDVNDRRFIDAVLEGNPETVFQRAEDEFSACSVGAVLGAMGFVQSVAQSPAPELLAYSTSADGTSADGTSADAQDADVPDSFVGYAAMIWRARQ
jgi:AmmeMemoRadiSam system protein B